MVDLLEQRHRNGIRFEPTELIEQGPRVAVGLTVGNPSRQGEAAADVFKVFSFEGEQAVLLQDCTGRDDALARLTAE